MRNILISLILIASCLCLCQCEPLEPTYNRQNIPSSIVKFSNEKNIKVKAEIFGSTLWVYYPTSDLINLEGEFTAKAQEKISDVLEIIQRIALSCGESLQFFVLVASDVKVLGVDSIFVGYIPDIRKAKVLGLSRYEYFDRNLQELNINLAALGDYEGKHLDYVDISLPKFLAEQILRRIRKKFQEGEILSNYFTINTESWDIEEGDFIFDISLKKISKDVPAEIDPQKAMLEIIAFVLTKYDFTDFQGVKLYDPLEGGFDYFSREQIYSFKK